ncbi:helix-turn-helix transcriptional regulator [uncultured Kriegella sp.]|uniref:helix-turn-helix domain-containing protein n=1 Tax=uncultured Kriegella sp. TaxID=1798910 RepID=UPI0030D6DA86|tara:strand:- start:172386 stop:172763 length:378 start_codon:yes stop_codon:yes gene_type:complete
MVNTEDFIGRLDKLLRYHNLSASSFADKVGVQRSSISHLLSGRNKPSLEFVLKVIKTFPEVNLYWLLNGKGAFPSDNKEEPLPTTSKRQNVSEKPKKAVIQNKEKSIEKIVIFYSDGSFKSYDGD